MAQWECIVCGWVYDEAKGDPENGVAAGTKWDDVPESWLCPDCCVGKEDFEIVAGTEDEVVASDDSDSAAEADNGPLVIIGTGLAGYNLVKEIRRIDADKPIIMLTSDDGHNYSKPMLSTGFTKNKDAAALSMGDAGKMALQFNVSIWTNTVVSAIDTDHQRLSLSTGASLEYGKLVIAWGADTIKPPMEGDGLDMVFSINDLVDYDNFRKAMSKAEAKKVAIIGGGLIGSEFTNDLQNGGFETETIDPMGYTLPTLLPEAAGKAVQTALEAQGAKFHFGPLDSGEFGPVATAVNKTDSGVEVVLNNGVSIAADAVVSAVGVRPRIALAEASGIAVNRGVIGNKFLETSAKNVYTLGDCAEIEGHVLFYVAPLLAGAKALAKTLTGTPTEVSYPAMPVTIKTPTCPVVVSPAPRDAEGEWTIDANGADVVAEFRNGAGELLGFALTGANGVKEKMRLQKELPPIMA
ncbi:MAG: FAD-dependent oxidoreductase [Pseudomonadales bacterium]|nr:FAD-dependent oxidoreductase [Pseudomonadales bacterium]